MPEKKTKTEAQIRAQKKYMENFVEIKVRMTADKRHHRTGTRCQYGRKCDCFY